MVLARPCSMAMPVYTIVVDCVVLDYCVGGVAQPEAVVAVVGHVFPEHVVGGEDYLECVVGGEAAVVALYQVVV